MNPLPSFPFQPSKRSSSWQWPLDLGQYNRTAELTLEEHVQLDHMARRKIWTPVFSSRDAKPYPLSPDAPLARLLQPIYDVWKVTAISGQECTDTLVVLCREMHRRRRTYWAWNHEQWCESLASTTTIYRKSRNCRRTILCVSYLLCGFVDPRHFPVYRLSSLASTLLGEVAVQEAIQRTCRELHAWGYSAYRMQHEFPNVIALLLLTNRSPFLEDLSSTVVDRVYQSPISSHLKDDLRAVSRILVQLGYLEHAVDQQIYEKYRQAYQHPLDGVSSEWAQWAKRWDDTSTLAPRTRQTLYGTILKAGRWYADRYPGKTSPTQWTRETALAFVAAVDRMRIGEWVVQLLPPQASKKGIPLSAATKAKNLEAMRVFFRDGQEWGWFPRCFDPSRCLATPRSVRALIGPDPRIIADDIWAKLLWAGLNLQEADLPATNFVSRQRESDRAAFYPVEMVRAMAIVWLFTGLRSDEFYRLRVGCIRWQREDVTLTSTEEVLPKDAVCWLDVPVHKTGTSFTKAVDRIVGEAIFQWERARPPHQPPVADRKTNEIVHMLFSYRGRGVGRRYLNETLIPMLCRKAGIPPTDARGPITSHRARSTIASQLFNAKEPLSLFELQEWLGHRLVSSTQHYAKKSPTQVAKAYEKAGYFGRNVRTISVLVDQEAIKSGRASAGDPWRFYDLGHGYCLYEFFDQCPHRMACAKCAFYCPKGSTQAQLLEGKANLLHMLQEIPLSDEERAAVEDGIEAMEKLCQQLADVPTPAGPTPNQLSTGNQGAKTSIPLENVRWKR